MWSVVWCAAVGARWCEQNKDFMRYGKAFTGPGEKGRRIAIFDLSFDLDLDSRIGKNETRSRFPEDRENRDLQSAFRSPSPTLHIT